MDVKKPMTFYTSYINVLHVSDREMSSTMISPRLKCWPNIDLSLMAINIYNTAVLQIADTPAKRQNRQVRVPLNIIT